MVADNVNTIYIAGGYWKVEIDKEFVSKTILAEIIELAGELPEPGKGFIAKADGNEEAVGITHIYTSEAKTRIETTDMIILSKRKVAQRVLQDPETLDILLVGNVYIDMIDMKSIDNQKGECAPEGLHYNKLSGIYLWNNVMKFQVSTRYDDKHKHITDYLSSIDLNEIPEEE